MCSYWVYTFEGESLQRYIFSTGKLRDVSGASELIAHLAFEFVGNEGQKLSDEMLAEWPRDTEYAAHVQLETFRSQKSVSLCSTAWLRHAGGVFSVAIENPPPDFVEGFRDHWRFYVATELLGLSFKDGIGYGSTIVDASKMARQDLIACPPMAIMAGPPANPLMRPASRTGKAAVHIPKRTTDSEHSCKIVKGEFVDAATVASRWFLLSGDRPKKKPILHALFIGFEAGGRIEWPIFLTSDEEPAEDESEGEESGARSGGAALFSNDTRATLDRQTLAVVHIDGNGFGALFTKAEELDKRREGSAKFLTKSLSNLLNKAMVLSARHAVRKVLLPWAHDSEVAGKPALVVPARPVLLGGDDLTIIVRGELALLFVYEFTKEFETQMQQLFTELGQDFADIISELHHAMQHETGAKYPTVKAGVAIIGAKQPFYRGYRLAEALTNEAGRAGKDRSRVAFWRETGASIPESIEEIMRNLNASENGGGSIWRSSWPILASNICSASTETSTLESIFALKECLDTADIPSSALREVVGVWRESQTEGEKREKRALEVLERKNNIQAFDLREKIKAARGDQSRYSPLMDAHVLHKIGARTKC